MAENKRPREKELILKAKKDPKYKLKLLEIYYKDACRWAEKYINRILYTNLVAPTKGEIKSLVYQAFEKTIKNIDPERSSQLSFRNYFYMMIKYQSFSDLKNVLNCGVVQNFNEEKNQIEQEQKQNYNSEREYINKLDALWKTERIMNFLQQKNEKYSEIVKLKIKGYKNSEICKIMNISEISLKARLQYIRKLIREHFSSFDEIF